jgi:hypothetical protein
MNTRNDNLYNPFAWIMFPIAVYAIVLQTLVLGDPPTVRREDLGRLGR